MGLRVKLKGTYHSHSPAARNATEILVSEPAWLLFAARMQVKVAGNAGAYSAS